MASNTTTMTVPATMPHFKPSSLPSSSGRYGGHPDVAVSANQKPSMPSTPTCNRVHPGRKSLGTFSPRPITSTLADEPGAIVRLRFEEKKRLERMKLKRPCGSKDDEAPAAIRPAPMH
uniref:Uncharacterized protein n=1 Tax=Panagrellus redivivus TaxID=6233 RepID=A0A7E4W7N8_PANRE